MQRILWLWLLLALFLGIVCSVVAFGQQPAKNVEMEALVNFDFVIGEIRETFTEILREYWAFFLTIFFVWFGIQCAKSFLDGKMEMHMAEIKKRERITKRVNAITSIHGVQIG
jgi:uncharacterized membrane protein